jgi:hypothetical protein
MAALTNDDYLFAGEVAGGNRSTYHVHCAGCMLRIPYVNGSALVAQGWKFEKYTVGWLCPFCHENYKKGLIIAFITKEYSYHLYCAIAHGFTDVEHMTTALEKLQKDRVLTICQVSSGKDVGYYSQVLPDQTGRWCEVCGSKLTYYPY